VAVGREVGRNDKIAQAARRRRKSVAEETEELLAIYRSACAEGFVVPGQR
jgi:hypothetical protein